MGLAGLPDLTLFPSCLGGTSSCVNGWRGQRSALLPFPLASSHDLFLLLTHLFFFFLLKTPLAMVLGNQKGRKAGRLSLPPLPSVFPNKTQAGMTEEHDGVGSSLRTPSHHKHVRKAGLEGDPRGH